MNYVDVNINLGPVDLDTLTTEDEIREAAKKLVPNALREIGKASAEIAWKEMQKAFSGPGFKTNNSASDKRKFIEDAGKEHARKARANDKKELEEYIISQIQAQKSNKT
jgi:hypothetical protein